MSINKTINFPNDIMTFGKYQGKEIQYVITMDKRYYNWILEKGLKVSILIEDFANGINPLQSRIKTKIKSKTDTLIIEKEYFYILPKLKFIRKNDKFKKVKTEILREIKIPIEYTIEKIKRSRSWLGNGMQHDDIHCSSEWIEEVKKYKEPDLQNFINEQITNYSNTL